MSSKNKATTKTTHVMNLLRKSAPPPSADPPPETEGSPAPETAPAVSAEAPASPAPSKHPIIASLNEDAAVAQEIKGALEEELAKSAPPSPAVPSPKSEPEESSAPAPAPEPEPVEIPAPAPEPEPVEIPAPAPEPEPVEIPAPAPEPEPVEIPAPAPEPEPVEIPAPTPEPEPANPPAPAPESEPEPKKADPDEAPFDCYDIMQILVERNYEKYMKMFGLCMCSRCQSDVKALALNGLQPKYVVLRPIEYVPRVTIFERQFNSTVTAQILRACNTVESNPRHDAPK